MLTFPPQRHQGDDQQDMYSADARTDMGDDRDNTRQEFAAELDIGNMMRKFGVMQRQDPPIKNGVIDYDVNLQTALAAIAEARLAHRKLPQALRDKYPTWQAMLTAVENLTFDDTVLAPPPEQGEDPPPATPPA